MEMLPESDEPRKRFLQEHGRFGWVPLSCRICRVQWQLCRMCQTAFSPTSGHRASHLQPVSASPSTSSIEIQSSCSPPSHNEQHTNGGHSCLVCILPFGHICPRLKPTMHHTHTCVSAPRHNIFCWWIIASKHIRSHMLVHTLHIRPLHHRH